MAIILVNLTFTDAELRRELVAVHTNMELIPSLALALRVSFVFLPAILKLRVDTLTLTTLNHLSGITLQTLDDVCSWQRIPKMNMQPTGSWSWNATMAVTKYGDGRQPKQLMRYWPYFWQGIKSTKTINT